MASSSNDSIPSLPSNGTETLPSIMSDKSYTNTCRILDYLKGLSDQVGKLGGEVTQLATFGTELRHSAHVANMTTGAVQSWQNEMSGYFDPKLIFTLANNALEDKGTRENLMKLGVDKKTLQTHDVDKISQAIIRKLPEYYKNNQTDALAKFHSLGFDPYGSYRDIARGLFNLPKGELNKVITSLNESEHRLNISDINIQHTQEVKRTIDRTNSIISIEKIKNSYTILSKVEKFLSEEIQKIDDKALIFDKATSSSGGVGYALFDITSRTVVPILNMLKDTLCKAPINKEKDDDNSDNTSSMTKNSHKNLYGLHLKEKNTTSNTPLLNKNVTSIPINPKKNDDNDDKNVSSASLLSIFLNSDLILGSRILSLLIDKEYTNETIKTLQSTTGNIKSNKNPYFENDNSNIFQSPTFSPPILGAISDKNEKTDLLPNRVPNSPAYLFPSVFLPPSKNTTYTSQAPQSPNSPLIDDRSFVVQIYNQTGQDFSAAAVASRTN